MFDPSQNKAYQIVEHAHKGGYAVPAICCYNIEGILASVRAAEAKKSPVLVQLFPWAVEYADGVLVHAAAEAARNASVPVAVHMDHAQTPDMVRRAADLGGFDGIMVDMSHYEREENLSKTKELVEYCASKGIVTEAEPGRITGTEDGVADIAELQSVLTTPEQAEEFVATGIQWLAPAFGNVHGKYGPQGPQLELDRLRGLVSAVGDRVRFVLHGAGAEYFDEKRFRDCVDAGMVKANINDIVNDAYLHIMREKAANTPLTKLLEEVTDAMQKQVELCMDWLGSTGKA
ncbi:hypothetical protein LTR05_000958 [Lithohypha guttulata]|uniref:Fructose-bisphosphate aldolase n=1 Tax=Lithohypha guttulata TaxID=1690604 RepID=A0AAN7YKX1_9EURO|nr:hypothetical protein LTR05_000958 [Lithohypha guttulata]